MIPPRPIRVEAALADMMQKEGAAGMLARAVYLRMTGTGATSLEHMHQSMVSTLIELAQMIVDTDPRRQTIHRQLALLDELGARARRR